MHFTTPVTLTPVQSGISYRNKILMLGSCFADEVGRYLCEYRFDARVNPFGTLYNPCSLANSIERLATGAAFTPQEVILSGGIYTSFSHHSSVSGPTAEAFLSEANARLEAGAAFFRQADTFVITLGTAYAYRHLASGKVVSNCHKIKAAEFERRLLSVEECVVELQRMIGRITGIDRNGESGKGIAPERPKQIIFTVSPIRHLKDGAHGNQISKATLLLAVEEVLRRDVARAEEKRKWDVSNGSPSTEQNAAGWLAPPVHLHYFPAYELMMDELRDYRFYAADMVHPSALAVEYIFERFKECFISKECYPLMREAMRLTKAENHRPLFPDTPEYARFLEKLEQDRLAFQQQLHTLTSTTT